jgi:hypothetical protein
MLKSAGIVLIFINTGPSNVITASQLVSLTLKMSSTYYVRSTLLLNEGIPRALKEKNFVSIIPGYCPRFLNSF